MVLEGSLPTLQYQQGLALISDLVTRLTSSIGRSHQFRLIRGWFHGSVLSFANVQGFLKELKRTPPRLALAAAGDVLERDLSPGSLAITVVIGQSAMRSIINLLEENTQAAYVIGKLKGN